MATRQEERTELRKYGLGPAKSHKFNVNWANMPGWAAVDINEAMLLTGHSKNALRRRLEAGKFPQPGRDGKKMIWRLSDIRAFCEAVIAPVGGVE